MRHVALGVLVVTILLGAGCSANVGPEPSVVADVHGRTYVQRGIRGASRGWLSPRAKTGKSLLYVSYIAGPEGDEVVIFDQRGNDQQPVGEITQGIDAAIGLCVDEQRNLYAANYANGTVTVYPPGSTSPSETLTGAGSPFFVAVGRSGTVYVGNGGNASAPNATLLEYRKGHTTPFKTIALAAGIHPAGLGLDSAGNLYAVVDRPQYASSRLGSIVEFPGGLPPAEDLGIHVSHPSADLQGLAVDRTDDLLVADETANGVDIIPPGGKVPSELITGWTGCCVVDLALNRANTELWATVTDILNVAKIVGVTYPAGQIVDTISPAGIGAPLGVATSPDGAP